MCKVSSLFVMLILDISAVIYTKTVIIYMVIDHKNRLLLLLKC